MAQQLRAERAYEQEQQGQPEQPVQPRREPPKKRNSRGAATAQQHRDDRKERARLDSLRDKQKRKAKKTRHRRISPDAWKRIIIMAAVLAAVVLSMVIFFRVNSVEVRGNRFYTAQEIIDAAGITVGDNLLTLSRGEIAGNVLAHKSMVKQVRVTRQLPNTIVLHITEYEASYAIQDTADVYYSVSASGIVGEQLVDGKLGSNIVVEGLKIQPTKAGEEIQLAADPGMEEAVGTQRRALLDLMAALENTELLRHVGKIEVPSDCQLIVWYGNRLEDRFDERFEVRLGASEQLDYKLAYLEAVVSQQKDYVTGIIDLRFRDGNEAHVIPNN